MYSTDTVGTHFDAGAIDKSPLEIGVFLVAIDYIVMTAK